MKCVSLCMWLCSQHIFRVDFKCSWRWTAGTFHKITPKNCSTLANFRKRMIWFARFMTHLADDIHITVHVSVLCSCPWSRADINWKWRFSHPTFFLRIAKSVLFSIWINRYRAIYKYRPQNSDELELQEGDTVYVLEKCDDGWFVGTSQRTGFFGNYLFSLFKRLVFYVRLFFSQFAIHRHFPW